MKGERREMGQIRRYDSRKKGSSNISIAYLQGNDNQDDLLVLLIEEWLDTIVIEM